jgi:hypothetical protein
MAYVLIRDGEVNKVHVYNNLTPEASEMLVFLASHLDIISVHHSDEPYDPAIAYQFLETGEVNEEHLACTPE